MIGVDDQAAPAAMPAQSGVSAPVSDPLSRLSAVYRDYPGLRALILRRVRDPQIAADILQDAAVTTLEKLRSGEIAHPENIGGYLFRVAINHLRNHRRRDRSGVSSPDDLDDIHEIVDDPEWQAIGRDQWARAARGMLQEMAAERDREVLVRFYLHDEAKDQICRELQLTHQHFNRVIFRARVRFRELLEQRGIGKSDLLGIVTIGLLLSASAGGHLGAVHRPGISPAATALAAPASVAGDPQ
jgi:RNA polymerase sigma-70 factor (ECF subfamily)